jgi:4-amino-4-deoxy-L-arabinose transferase-like glycosyltransferase
MPNPASDARRMQFIRRRELVWLSVVVLAALVFRVALASLPRVIRWDEPDYLWLGRSLLSGHGYTIVGVPELHYTPLFPLLAGAIYRLSGNAELGSSFWYVLLGALVTVPIYFLARRIYGRQVALLSAALVAFFPALSSAVLYWGTMTEPLFIFWIYCALWAAAVAVDEHKIWAYALTGALLCLAYLSRPEGLVWFAALGALWVLVWIWQKRFLRWHTLACLIVYVVTFVLLAIPYAAFMHAHTGRWMATGKLSITYDIGEAVMARDPVLYDKVTASIDSTSGEILWWSNKRFERSLLNILLDDPAKFLQRTWDNLRQLRGAIFSASIFPLFLLAPVILGWFKDPWDRRRLRHEALLAFGGLPVLAFLPFHIEIRFFSPAFPALLIWVAAGLWTIGAWAVETVAHWRRTLRPGATIRWQTIVVIVLTILLAGYLGFVHVHTIQRGMGDLPYAHKAAGLWLKENTPREAAIMSRDLAVSLYAERGFVVSPRADYKDYLDYAQRKGATYLLVDERELRVLRPYLAFLLDDAAPPPELEPVFSVMDEHGRTIVYRIKG